MPASRALRNVGMALLIALLSALPGRSLAAADPPSPQKVAALIRQLGSRMYAEREAATEELRALGPAVVPLLNGTLKQGRLSAEAEERIKDLVFRLYVPQHGLVWRDHGDIPTPEGLLDGDVIVKCNGGAARSRKTISALLQENPGQCTLVVWRQGRGDAQVVSSMGREQVSGLLNWPDPKELYLRYGQKGPWDTDLLKALPFADRADLRMVPLFRAAWDAGCRDPLVLYCWKKALDYAGRDAEGLELIQREMPRLVGRYPGGRYRYGELPSEVVRGHILAGRMREATDAADRAVKEALAADAFKAVPYIRLTQFRLKLLESPDAALRFLEETRKQMQLTADSREGLEGFAEALAGEGDPTKALAMLAGVRSTAVAQQITDVYKRQAELAGRYREQIPPENRMALVWWEYPPIHQAAPLNRYNVRDTPRVKLPVRLEAEARMADFPEEHSEFQSVIRISAHKDGQSIVDLFLDRLARATARSTASPLAYHHSIQVGGVREWHKVTIDIFPNVVRLRVDGRGIRTWYHDDPWSGTVTFSLFVCGSEGEFRNVRYYIPGIAGSDVAGQETAPQICYQAMVDGDLPTVRREYEKLRAVWAQLPAAAPFVSGHDRGLKLYEPLFTKEGLAICSKETVPAAGGKNPALTLRDGWLVVRGAGPGKPSGFGLPLVSPDFELTGIAHAPDLAGTREWGVYWAYNILKPWSRHAQHCTPYLVCDPGKHRYSISDFEGRMQGAELQGVDPTAPQPFCLRARRDRACLFVGSAQKPLLSWSGIDRVALHFGVYGVMDPNATMRFHSLVLRHLPKDTAIDAPAQFPKLPS